MTANRDDVDEVDLDDPTDEDVELDPDLDAVDDVLEDDGADDLALDDEVLVEGSEDEFDDDTDDTDALVPLAGFDDEDEEDDDALLAAVDEDDLDDDREAVKEGEFVCRSCFLVKTTSQLADAANQYCRDCA